MSIGCAVQIDDNAQLVCHSSDKMFMTKYYRTVFEIGARDVVNIEVGHRTHYEFYCICLYLLVCIMSILLLFSISKNHLRL